MRKKIIFSTLLTCLIAPLQTNGAKGERHVPYSSMREELEKEYGQQAQDANERPAVVSSGLLGFLSTDSQADVAGFGLGTSSGTAIGVLALRGNEGAHIDKPDYIKISEAIAIDKVYYQRSDFYKYINPPTVYSHGINGNLNDAIAKVERAGTHPTIIVASFGREGGLKEAADIHVLGGQLWGKSVVDSWAPLAGSKLGHLAGFSGGYPSALAASGKYDITFESRSSYGSTTGPRGMTELGGIYSHDRPGSLPVTDFAVGAISPRVVEYGQGKRLIGCGFTSSLPFREYDPNRYLRNAQSFGEFNKRWSTLINNGYTVTGKQFRYGSDIFSTPQVVPQTPAHVPQSPMNIPQRSSTFK